MNSLGQSGNCVHIEAVTYLLGPAQRRLRGSVLGSHSEVLGWNPGGILFCICVHSSYLMHAELLFLFWCVCECLVLLFRGSSFSSIIICPYNVLNVRSSRRRDGCISDIHVRRFAFTLIRRFLVCVALVHLLRHKFAN